MVASDVAINDNITNLIIPDDTSGEPLFRAYVEAKVYDKEGHIIEYRRQPMKSLTQYFLALMSIPLVGTYQGASINQATNILINVFGFPAQISDNTSSSYNHAVILWSWSIQVGSGTQTFSPTLNSLAAPIANGSGTGQLSYSSTIISYSSSSISATVEVFNSTSSAINVTEIGLIGNIYIAYIGSSGSYTYNTYTYLLSYDVFSSAVTVPANAFAAFQVTVSFAG